MKKTILVSALALGMSLTLSAQSKINPAGRLLLQEYKARCDEMLKNGGDILAPMNSPSIAEPAVKAVVILREGYGSSVIDVDGVDVVSEMSGVLVVNCPMSAIERLAAMDEVQSIGFGDTLQPSLDFARPACSVDNVTAGFTYDSQTVSFDGTGVVCGMYDTGFEANHINFKNTDGTSRIQRLWHMTGSDGKSYTEYTPSNISGFQTDDKTGTHATHVAGIMCGGYKGDGRYMYLSSPSGGSGGIRSDSPIPFYGVATGSDPVFSVGTLATGNILEGVIKIVEYAESTGQPCVVNLSIGSTIGSHDGTDYYSSALSRLGKRAIICIAAGNDGDNNISISKTLSATGNNAYLRTFPVTTDNDGKRTATGVVDLWTDSSEPVTFAWKVFKGNAATAETIMEITQAGKRVNTSNNAVFSKYFNGAIDVISSVDPGNNRYNVYSTVNDVITKDGQTGTLMLEVTGDSGTKLYLFGSSSVAFTNKSVSGSTPLAITGGSPANSINDAACSKNVVSVGSFTTRNVWGVLSGNAYQYASGGYTIGDISPFSSYGTAFDGTKLPLICAPGANIISSISRFTLPSNAEDKENAATAEVTSGGVSYYWGPMQGTSMACPYVSGTVALWLQACPSLTYDQVMEVINNTSDYNDLTMKGGKWGAGKINALKGVQYVLEHYSAIGGVWEDDESRFLVTPAGDGYDVTLAGEAAFNVTVYDLQGRPVASAPGADGAATVATSHLIPGIYIVKVQGASATLSRKIQVR